MVNTTCVASIKISEQFKESVCVSEGCGYDPKPLQTFMSNNKCSPSLQAKWQIRRLSRTCIKKTKVVLQILHMKFSQMSHTAPDPESVPTASRKAPPHTSTAGFNMDSCFKADKLF